VTREAVLQLARREGIPVLEQPFGLPEALAADEFLMTGTTTEVAAVIAIDGKKIGTGKPGPVTRGLKNAFDALVKQECG
jgi:branched-subunit amino acid aminotransferase/4-amino-4-deoxychorismate lyase